ncbi:MAG: N-formylglutamate amidohydrolase [Myxococcota bacterium]
MLTSSIEGVLDVERFGPAEGSPDLVIEVPHGATETQDYLRLEARLQGEQPADLVAFFHVNTDVGAPELATSVASKLSARGVAVLVLRCRVPRTFVDTNRRLDTDPGLAETNAVSGRITPGLAPWLTQPEDQALLVELHRQYTLAVEAVLADALPQAGLLLLHSYAPRSVDVEVTERIVDDLRAAYEPDKAETWPLRPPIDLIHRLPDGRSLQPVGFFEALNRAFDGVELVGDNLSYPLHPVTMAHGHAIRWPGRVVCLEVRRDLLADPFVPLKPVRISSCKVDRLARPLTDVVEARLL